MIRTMVSGHRNRFQNEQYNLDITYITPRVLAMSFPASTVVEKAYRNPIETVAQFLKEKHQNKYKVFNLTGREYDTAPFLDQVQTY